MSGDDKGMDEILGDIRALSRGETPERRAELETLRVGLLKRSLLLMVPAAMAAIVLYGRISDGLNLPGNVVDNSLVWLPVLFMSGLLDDARPSCRRHWMILVLTSIFGGVASAIAGAGMVLFLSHLAPEYTDGFLAALAAMLVCSAAILLVLWTADGLFRKDNLIFPRVKEEAEK